jgi:hypothetical protein
MENNLYPRIGYVHKLIKRTNGADSWYRGYVQVPVWHPIFPLLPDYETISMMINSPVELTYADHIGVGFDTQVSADRSLKQLNDLYQTLVNYESSEDETLP